MEGKEGDEKRDEVEGEGEEEGGKERREQNLERAGRQAEWGAEREEVERKPVGGEEGKR